MSKEEKRAVVMTNKLEKLEANIINWAKDRNILNGEASKNIRYAQFTKTVEEVAELGSAISKSNRAEAIDAIGDIIVTLVVQAHIWGADLEECLESAYNEIKDRKGKLVGGVFIKEKA